MKERPILFSAPMVRALLDGTKTQTRRVVKLRNGQYMPPSQRADRNGWAQMLRLCPYGQPGDRLWVREAWAAPHKYDGHRPADIPALTRWHYAATENLGGLRGRPSIHMPRCASRITLEVTGVRVERLQDISADDAAAEGIRYESGSYELEWMTPFQRDQKRIADYSALWESINGPESWAANPWVWAVEFKRVEVTA